MVRIVSSGVPPREPQGMIPPCLVPAFPAGSQNEQATEQQRNGSRFRDGHNEVLAGEVNVEVIDKRDVVIIVAPRAHVHRGEIIGHHAGAAVSEGEQPSAGVVGKEVGRERPVGVHNAARGTMFRLIWTQQPSGGRSYVAPRLGCYDCRLYLYIIGF